MSFFITEKQVELLLPTTSCSPAQDFPIKKCSKPRRAHYTFPSTSPPTGRYGFCSPSTEETQLVNNLLLIRNTLLLCRYLCSFLDCQPYLASVNLRLDTSNLRYQRDKRITHHETPPKLAHNNAVQRLRTDLNLPCHHLF